jgi:hypothetical protein
MFGLQHPVETPHFAGSLFRNGAPQEPQPTEPGPTYPNHRISIEVLHFVVHVFKIIQQLEP